MDAVIVARENTGHCATMEGSVQFSEIQHFYKNSTVLLTGATGFVGKLLLEKLLRQCHVRRVYALVRDKDGADAEARCAEIFDATVRYRRNSFLYVICSSFRSSTPCGGSTRNFSGRCRSSRETAKNPIWASTNTIGPS